MGKKFVFVSGDIGGAMAQLPVARFLTKQGHKVKIYVDDNGLAQHIFRKENMNFIVLFSPVDLTKIRQFITDSDLVLVNTCASATDIELAFVKHHSYPHRLEVPLVLGSDGLFNHGFKKWQEAHGDYWFAINEGHKQAILKLRPGLSSERVKVVGQPAFDGILDLIPKKAEIKEKRRNELGLGDSPTVLWWATGMGELIEEDVRFTKEVIKFLGTVKNSTFIPMIHPKLESTYYKGCIKDIYSQIRDCCHENSVKVINFKFGDFSPEELCLAVDTIISITSTEDIKSTMIGGPPVVHLLGPVVRDWMEKDLALHPPCYLPDIKTNEALAVTSLEEIPSVINQALNPDFAKALRLNWQMPIEKATEKVANELIRIASVK